MVTKAPRITYRETNFHGTNVIKCIYPLQGDTTPMTGYNEIFLHNTFKYKTPEQILACHLERGFSGIGYHFAIEPSGKVFYTRPISTAGAHAYGHNQHSVGVVLIDVNACGQSYRARRSWQRLRRSIEDAVGSSLQTLSHTHGQFLYLADEIQNEMRKEAQQDTAVTPGFAHDGARSIMPDTKYDTAHIAIGTSIINEEQFLATAKKMGDLILTVKDEAARARLLRLHRGLKRCPETSHDRLMTFLRRRS